VSHAHAHTHPTRSEIILIFPFEYFYIPRVRVCISKKNILYALLRFSRFCGRRGRVVLLVEQWEGKLFETSAFPVENRPNRVVLGHARARRWLLNFPRRSNNRVRRKGVDFR